MPIFSPDLRSAPLYWRLSLCGLLLSQLLAADHLSRLDGIELEHRDMVRNGDATADSWRIIEGSMVD